MESGIDKESDLTELQPAENEGILTEKSENTSDLGPFGNTRLKRQKMNDRASVFHEKYNRRKKKYTQVTQI